MSNNKNARFGRQDMQIVAEENGYKGFFRLLKVRLRHRLFAGGWGPELTRELFDRGHAAAVLPYDPVRDEVVLVEQFRVGAIHHGDSPWLLEVVAGIVENGESEEAVVRREAQEEAGLTLGRLTRAMSYFSSPGGCSERITVFVGEVDATQAATYAGLSGEGEDIRVHCLPRAQAMQWLADGRIDNAASVIALQWLALNRKSGLWPQK
ncbi:ADP-ribose diphosphatase [Oceanimonas baumannii]|uniref:ADP-ribose pyrophosphatase n=1 Tax=Oceanimonas baumannii TaxID=129578 RepID=A0A235CM71_9GAMM|nr:ADP-ribose diphosphatase [Oceanimonas baumannii]OYD25526.1 ADP-ribose diphosphatase [Oceanimonas baumannii]TDW61269.1 ADP-ribose pyrophosphatase [Oceanimonas baumannii]